jgi:hypothetical protein
MLLSMGCLIYQGIVKKVGFFVNPGLTPACSSTRSQKLLNSALLLKISFIGGIVGVLCLMALIVLFVVWLREVVMRMKDEEKTLNGPPETI